MPRTSAASRWWSGELPISARRASKRSRNMNIRRVAIGRPAASALRAKAEAKRRREGLRYARVRLQPDTTDAQVALNAALPMRLVRLKPDTTDAWLRLKLLSG